MRHILSRSEVRLARWEGKHDLQPSRSFGKQARHGLLTLVIAGCVLITPAVAQGVPLPPKRPANLTVPPVPVPAMPDNAAAVGTVPSVPDCTARLEALGLVTEKAVLPKADNAACLVTDAVRMTGLRLSDRVVTLPDRPVLDCRAAMAVGSWLRDIVVPISEAHLRTQVTALETGPGFECRNRNRAKVGKLSAHSNGLAIDVARIRFADRSVLVVEKPEGEAQRQVLDTLRKSACGWFTTVLGPGSDAAHADHLHLDVELRGASGTGRYCQ